MMGSTRLRDIDLRWANDDPAPPGFLKRGPVEYLYHRELRELKIETPKFSKINVYCDPKKTPYDGVIHDGVTAVHIACRWSSIEALAPKEIAAAFAGLLAEGAETVLSHFAISAGKLMTSLAEQVQRKLFDPVAFGKPATQTTAERLSARLQVRSAESLEYAIVTVAIKRGRTLLGELSICTTFPMFDYAIENLDSFQWDSSTRLTATFARSPADVGRQFGRRNFDGDGFEGVTVVDTADRRRRSFTLDVSSLTSRG